MPELIPKQAPKTPLFSIEELYLRYKLAILPGLQKDYTFGGSDTDSDWEQILEDADKKAQDLVKQHLEFVKTL